MERPGVGLATIIMKLKEKEVLLGKRKNAHGAGTWAFPGGHIEFYEEYIDCFYRELEEETGLTRDNIRLIDKFPVAATNDFFKKEGKHYITLYMRAELISGEPKVMEPEKCEKWIWSEWYNGCPLDVFVPLSNLRLKQNYDPFKDLK